MKRLKILMFPILMLIGIFICNQKTKAETYEYFEYQYHDGIFYTHTGGGFFFNDKYATYSMDGKTVYCIEPYANLGTHNYIGESGFVNSPFSAEVNRKIELIGHYGYDYPGHQTLKYRMATQALIWEAVDGHKVTFYTEAFGYGDVISVDAERNEIMALVNAHYNKPSFQAQTFNVILNQPIEIEDTSGVLNGYEVYNANGNDVSINGNKLTITPKTVGNSQILFIRSKYDNATTFVFKPQNGDYQKLAFFRSSDPSLSYLNLNVVGGKIRIKKVDSETNSTSPQGQATLKGAKYQILDSSNNVVETLVIGDDNTAISDYLPQGTYKIKEIQASTGYTINSEVYTVELTSSDIKEVIVKEDVIKGKIKVLKVDKENNSCIAQGGASLIGAKYQILDSSNNVVDTVTIGTDCTGTSKELPYGNYKVKESSSSTGYKIDVNVYSANITNENTIEITSKEQVIKGKIQVLKVDKENNSCTAQGGASLIGAKYQILDLSNNVVDTITIGTDCTGTSKELVYGNYKVKESSSSTGYELDTNVYNANITNENTIEITSKEQVIKGKIKVLKVDKENNSCTPQGQASLIGAKYQVLDLSNNVVDTITIGTDCTGTSKELPYGNYKVKELSSSTGYELDTNVYNANITTKNTIEITSKEQVIKNYISILKQYDFVDGTTQFLNAEANIVFEIYYPDNTKYGEVKTDKNGYATLEIPYGVWKFHQVNSNTGFEKIYDFYIVVDENSPKEHYYNILNNKLAAYLQVLKVDSETGEKIAIKNTTFKILNIDTNQYISQFVGGKVLDKFYTDENGIMMTYLKLEAGNYKLIEIESPNGYLLDVDGLEFSIGEDTHYAYTTYGAIVTVTFKNSSIKGKLEVTKTGEIFVPNNGEFYYDKKNLSGIEFEIYAAEDILSSDKNYLYYEKDVLVDTIITDEQGTAISKELPLGKYYFIETKTLDDYILDNEKHYFELSEVDNKTAIVYEYNSMFNYLKKGKLTFTKTDLVNGDIIPNTKIEIYTEQDELVFIGITDEEGCVTIPNLKLGKYYIIETESSTGYVLTDERVYFDIRENGEIVKAEMKNKPITSDLEFTKTDLSTSEPLPNTIIEIYTEQDELIFSGVTDEEGKIIIKDLRYGKYYIQEKEAPEGYILNTEKMYFEVLKDGEIIKSTMTNEKIKGKLEFTKVDLSTSEPLPNTIIEIYTEQDELVFSGVTDEEGKIVIEELVYGKYYILEKQALSEYVLNTEKMYFEVLKDGEIIKSTMTNEKIKSLIRIKKVDGENNILSGVTIGIYDSNDNLIYEGITDENGYIEIELDYGKYYYKEIETIDGYVINEEKVYFEVINNDEILEYTLINVPEDVEVPDTQKDRNIVFDILLCVLFFIGIGLVIYAKKNDNK